MARGEDAVTLSVTLKKKDRLSERAVRGAVCRKPAATADWRDEYTLTFFCRDEDGARRAAARVRAKGLPVVAITMTFQSARNVDLTRDEE